MAEEKERSRFRDFFRTLSVSDKKKMEKDETTTPTPTHKRPADSEYRRKRHDSDDDHDHNGTTDHSNNNTNTTNHAHPRRHRRRSSPPEGRRRHADDPRWPPDGVDELPLGKAMDLISKGVPIHRGHKRPVPHGPDDYFPLGSRVGAGIGGAGGIGGIGMGLGLGLGFDPPRTAPADDPSANPADDFYLLATTTTGNRPEDTDCASLRDTMVRPMTMRRVQSDDPAENPWDTLEQPSYSFYFGKIPGTITLTQWAAMSSNLPVPAPPLPDNPTRVTLRDVDLPKILDRLRELEKGGAAEEDGEEELYRSLYRRFLRDPDRGGGSGSGSGNGHGNGVTGSPPRTLDRQIADLVVVLSRPEWIDFANPKNQIATRFIFDPADVDPAQFLRFFYQLVLSLELDLRVNNKQTPARDRLVAMFPPAVQWSLALARRWRDNVRVESHGAKPDQVKFRYRRRRKQVKMLEDFTRIMKWPNATETIKALRQMDADNVLDSISSHALAFFSGLILPGATWPFIVICTLIDVDPDSATDKLALLTHLQPHCGFQYRNTHTYWSASSIVGKVLAPTARSVGGWVGPCKPTDHLGRSQIAKIRSHRSRQRMPVIDMASMIERSDPLGPPADVYPVREYDVRMPDLDGGRQRRPQPVSHITLSQLCFKAIGALGEEPRWFEASILFTVDKIPVPLRLKYDVFFISAFPCSAGPHPLFFDYTHRLIDVDEIMTIQNWGALHPEPEAGQPPPEDAEDRDKVLAIEAYGARDNEVFARAWCSYWGLSAVVADVRRTCIACAIREAFASTLTVLILVDGKAEDVEGRRSGSGKRDDSRSRREKDGGGRGDRDRDRDRERDRDKDDPRGTRGSLHR